MTRYLVDTNVLLRGAVSEASLHHTATNAIAMLLARGDELVITPQVLIEFWSVATRPTNVNGFTWPVNIVRQEIEKILDQFPLLPETPVVFSEWLRLVTQYQIVGKQVHDARLVAFLHVYQVPRLLTFNICDYRIYSILAASPDDVITHRISP